ncbi:MAG: hypothetical protein ABIC95_05770 [archaeon]
MGDAKSLQGLEDEEPVQKCPDCGSTDLGYEKGERFCRKCGFVFE